MAAPALTCSAAASSSPTNDQGSTSRNQCHSHDSAGIDNAVDARFVQAHVILTYLAWAVPGTSSLSPWPGAPSHPMRSSSTKASGTRVAMARPPGTSPSRKWPRRTRNVSQAPSSRLRASTKSSRKRSSGSTPQARPGRRQPRPRSARRSAHHRRGLQDIRTGDQKSAGNRRPCRHQLPARQRWTAAPARRRNPRQLPTGEMGFA